MSESVAAVVLVRNAFVERELESLKKLTMSNLVSFIGISSLTSLPSPLTPPITLRQQLEPKLCQVSSSSKLPNVCYVHLLGVYQAMTGVITSTATPLKEEGVWSHD